jgi:hypothetical protein
MLPHHAEVYTSLQAQFPGSEVYISSSNKVEGSKSAFNFEEKSKIMTTMHGIPADKIILAANPYLIDSYMKEFDQKNTMVIFAVGGKDEDRFPMKNIDDKTGLNMATRGETRPTYYQMINTLKQHPALPMSDRGYIYVTPTIAGGGEVASASAFRNAFTSVEDTEKRKEVFTKYMGTYNNEIFELFNNKLLGEIMSEQLDIMKYLAGLLQEAPINFDADPRMPDEDDEADEYADKPGFSQDNMINQLGKIIDSETAGNDAEQMKIKKFTPVTKVTTDDNKSIDVSPQEAKALKSMMDMLSSARMGEEQSAREKFLDAIQTGKGLLNMIDFAYDKKIVQQQESFVNDELDLSDIREDYDVAEGKLPAGLQAYQDKKNGKKDDDAEDDDKEVDEDKDEDKDEVDESRENCHSKTHDCATKVIHPTWGEGKPMYESHAVPTDEGYVAWYDVEFEHGIEKEVPAQDMEIITLAEHGAVNASKKTNARKECKSCKGKGCDHCGGTGYHAIEEDEEMQEELNDIRKRAGLEVKEVDIDEGKMKDIIIDAMQMSKEEFEATYGNDFDYEQLNKDYNEEHPDFKQEESMDPMNEPTNFDLAMQEYDDNGERGLSEYLGMSEQEFDQELNEYCAERGLHADDDREEAIQGVVEVLLDNSDEEAPVYAEALDRLKLLAGLI